jgi:hypothetical protein
MQIPYAVSNIPTCSCAMDFEASSYHVEMPSLKFLEVDYSDEENAHFFISTSRPALEEVSIVSIIGERKFVENLNQGNNSLFDTIIQQAVKNTSVSKTVDSSLSNNDPGDNSGKFAADDKVTGSTKDPSDDSGKVTANDRVTGLILIGVSEDVLCVTRNNRTEKFECQGTVVVSCKNQKTLKEDVKDDTSSNNVSMTISLQDSQSMLNNIKANKTFILSPVQPESAYQKIEIVAIPINLEKAFPVLRYTTVPTFRPFYFKARSKIRVITPNAKIYVQIIFNPIFSQLLEKMDSFLVQASLACLAFDKSSKVIVRPSDNFNETTKIVTWVCSTPLNVDKEPMLKLEAVVEGKYLSIRIIFDTYTLLTSSVLNTGFCNNYWFLLFCFLHVLKEVTKNIIHAIQLLFHLLKLISILELIS